MVTETGDAACEAGSPSADTGDKAVFCGYDPLWARLPIRLKGRFNKEYGGIALFGPCPRCEHKDGINVFIPTTWATASAAPGPGSAVVRAAAFVYPYAIEAEVDVEWRPPGVTAAGLEAQQQAVDVEWQPPGATAAGLEAQEQEIAEVIVCRCGQDFKHKPPSGKAGCGYWTYLRLRKGTIPDGH